MILNGQLAQTLHFDDLFSLIADAVFIVCVTGFLSTMLTVVCCSQHLQMLA